MVAHQRRRRGEPQIAQRIRYHSPTAGRQQGFIPGHVFRPAQYPGVDDSPDHRNHGIEGSIPAKSVSPGPAPGLKSTPARWGRAMPSNPALRPGYRSAAGDGPEGFAPQDHRGSGKHLPGPVKELPQCFGSGGTQPGPWRLGRGRNPTRTTGLDRVAAYHFQGLVSALHPAEMEPHAPHGRRGHPPFPSAAPGRLSYSPTCSPQVIDPARIVHHGR